MDKDTAKKIEKQCIARTYSRFDMLMSDGSGAVVTDSDGKKYIDCSSGIAVNVFGAKDEVWMKAVTEQLGKIQHICNLYYSEPQIRLAKLLCDRTGADKVFFCNSGAEANECAIKVARKYGKIKGRHEIITLKNSFHGRTIATLAATGQDEFHEDFGPFPEGFVHADACESSVKAHVNEKTCAVMIETVQCEGGVIDLSYDFLGWLDAYCRQNDILLIIDEVQTGNGRTGYLYSYMGKGLHPDIVTTAKGLAGGLPLGACMMFEKCGSVLTPGSHGSTFGGNAAACAGACTVIERLDDEFLLSVQKKGELFRAELSGIKGVEAVSGEGLIIGLKLSDMAPSDVAEKCLEKGLLVLTAKGKVRLLPPLTISEKEISEVCKILKEVIE
ncbi:MAG: acetylornithine/succinylornithine family transaminase [Clostridia bacterium]|nr:acetylornithine/succinylornithine family transaminase [Clostridia bacterium]